ncbi:MAG: FecR domain-containing protein [Bacteroidales bacterium]|nr:FecR domain-containing protein [Bacteroidales bacterium]
MEIPEEKIIRLADYARNRLDPVVESEMSKIVGNDETGRRLAREAARLELVVSAVHAQDSLNAGAALAQVRSRIKSSRRAKRLNFLRTAAAACFVPLLLITGFYVWNTHFRDDVNPITITTSTGVTSQFILPDGSKVWMNSNSSLTYPDKFKKGNRTVSLEGEAYFEVSKDSRRKFVVNASDVQIEVYGTRFNVDAYSNADGKVRTSLYQGSIALKFKDSSGDMRCITVRPGQKYIYDSALGKMSCSESDAPVETSWKEGRILFDSTPLAEVLRMIGNRYNIEFIVKDSSLLRKRYTGCFTNQRLEVVLAHFEKSAGMHFDLDYMGSGDDSSTLNGRQVIVVH